MSGEIYEKSRVYFDSLLRLLHPFMPFLTEELWHLLEERKKGESLAQASYPSALAFNSEFVERFEHSKLTVTSVRNLRSQVGMSPKESLVLYFSGKSPCLLGIVGKLANLSEILSVEVAPESASSFRIGQTEYYLQLGDRVNPEEEKEKLNKELAYQQGFLKSVQAKLNNERFVGSAPAQVVEREKAKMADAESKIEAIQLQLNKL
jgi:valyl-tRNA synthetase